MSTLEQKVEQASEDLQRLEDAEIIEMYRAISLVALHSHTANEIWKTSLRAGVNQGFNLEVTYYGANLGVIELFSRKLLENIANNKRLQELIEGAKNGK